MLSLRYFKSIILNSQSTNCPVIRDYFACFYPTDPLIFLTLKRCIYPLLSVEIYYATFKKKKKKAIGYVLRELASEITCGAVKPALPLIFFW